MGQDTGGFSKWQSVAVTRRAKLLEAGTGYRFRDWPSPALPEVAAGAYTLWEDNRLLYVGQAGARWSGSDRLGYQSAGVERGLYQRLQAHASGSRNGDPFCFAVWDRLLLPQFSRAEVKAIAPGSSSREAAIRAYITAHCAYRFVLLDDAHLIRQIVTLVRQGYLNAGRPLFNPLPDGS